MSTIPPPVLPKPAPGRAVPPPLPQRSTSGATATLTPVPRATNSRPTETPLPQTTRSVAPSNAAPSASRSEAERIKQLVFELQRVHSQLASRQVELNKLRADYDALTARTSSEAAPNPAHAASAELERQVTELQTRVSQLEAQAATRDARIRELETLLAEREARIVELEQVTSANAGRQSAKPAPEGLRRVRGIGPGYERALIALGITSLEQVAAWTESDVVEIAKRIRTRPERIVRDDWVGQARKLIED